MDILNTTIAYIYSLQPDFFNILVIGILAYISNAIRSYLKSSKKEKENELKQIEAKKSEELNSIPNTAWAHAKLNSIVNEMMFVLQPNRVLINKITNGGEIAKVGNALYVTAISECSGKVNKPIRDLYQKQVMGVYFTEFAADLLRKETKVLYTKNLPEASMLYDTYSSTGVEFSYSTITAMSSSEVYYITLHIGKNGKKEDSIFRNRMREYKQEVLDTLRVSNPKLMSYEDYLKITNKT